MSSSSSTPTVDPNDPKNWPVSGGTLTVPGTVTSINQGMIQEALDNKSVTQVDLTGTSITEVPSSTFKGYPGLTQVKLPNSVTSIGASAFEGCTSVSWVTMSPDLQTIGMNAFKNTGLTGINFPSNLKTIETSAFEGCGQLTVVNLHPCNDLTSIGASAFKDCKTLKTVSFPDGLTMIGKSAFEGCTGLTEITLPYPKAGAYCVIDQNAFATSGNTPLTITIPAGTGNFTFQAGSKAFENRTVTLNYSGSDKADIVSKLEAAGATVTNK